MEWRPRKTEPPSSTNRTTFRHFSIPSRSEARPITDGNGSPPSSRLRLPLASTIFARMATEKLSTIIEAAWDARETLSPSTRGSVREAVEEVLDALDSGRVRVAEKFGDEWVVHQWLKKAVLLSFRLNDLKLIDGGPGHGVWWDKVDSKFAAWDEAKFRAAGFRAVPGAIVRHSAYIAKGAVLMPSFVNVGARVGENTMVDTWATVGSCAQVGADCHISGGAGLGGVLEPLQAEPTIIEDNCFIGARSEVAEAVIVGEGSVLAMGTFLTATTK